MTTIETPTNILEWTLDKKTAAHSIFLKKKMREYTNFKKVVGFIHNEMGESYVGASKHKHLISTNIVNEKHHIEMYKNMYNTKDKYFANSYHLAKHKWGRVIPTNYTSASIFRRGLRHAICEDIYVDIDMQCCQPKIIYEMCKCHSQQLLVPSLKAYTTDPTIYRNAIVETHNVPYETAKALINAIVFGGSYANWKKKNGVTDTIQMPIIVELEAQIKTVIDIVYKANPQIKKDVEKVDPTKWKTEADAKRGVMGLWAQTIERMIQETAIMYLVNDRGFNLESIVSCQDGFMILKALNYDSILSDIEQAVLDAFSIEMKFVIKPFDEAIEIPEFNEGKSAVEWADAVTVKPLSVTLIKHFKDYILRNPNDGSLFVYYNNRWYNETDSKNQLHIIRYISENLYEIMRDEIMSDSALKADERDIILTHLRSNTSTNSRMTEIIKHAMSVCLPMNQEFDAKPFLLGFENGVFDLAKHEFRQYEYSDYMTMSTGYDFNDSIDLQNLDDEQFAIRNELTDFFDAIQPNPEDIQLLFQILASGLDGVSYQKVFFFNGAGGNGQGCVASLMAAVLGQYYGQPSNGVLYDIEKSNTASPDMMGLKGKRYINFKEVEGLLQASMLRNLTGGGSFSARYLHSNPVQFKMMSTFVMEFNNHPDLSGKPQESDYRRMVDFQFPTKFTDNPNKIGLTVGGSTYQKSNPYYISEEFTTKSRDIFLHMLLFVYKSFRQDHGVEFTIPQHVIERTDKYLKNQNVFHSIFSKYWEKCEVKCENGKMDKEDKKLKTVTCKQLWNVVQLDEEYRGLGARMKKNMYNRDAFYTWLNENFIVSTNKDKTQIIIGLESISNEA